MKLLSAALLAAALSTAACAKKKEEAKTEPAAKPTEPAAKPDPAATPTTPDPAKPEPAKPEAPKVVPAHVDELGAKQLAVTDKIVKAITDAGGDCAKMGTGLKALTEELTAAAAAEKELKKDPAAQQAFEEKFSPQFEAKMKDALPKLQQCGADSNVKAFTDFVSQN